MNVQLCDQILGAMCFWHDEKTWKQSCIIPMSAVTKMFQDLVLELPKVDIDRPNWTNRLQRFKYTFLLHREEENDQLIVALEQCIISIKVTNERFPFRFQSMPVFDFQNYEPQPTFDELMQLMPLKVSKVKCKGIENCNLKDLGMLIAHLGYFPMDLVGYSPETLEQFVKVYDRYPYLPTACIPELKPNQTCGKIHRLCERLWVHAIRDKNLITSVVGGLLPVNKKSLDFVGLQQLLNPSCTYSLYVACSDAVDDYEVITPAFLKFTADDFLENLGQKSTVRFTEGHKNISLNQLRVFYDSFPKLKLTSISYEEFDTLFRIKLRAHEFSIIDQSQQASDD